MIPEPSPHVARFERLGYGMFMHWGLYSQLGRGEWVMYLEHIPREEYSKLKDSFTAADFDGRAIAATARKAGMKYITLTSRHHEGFSLYDTRGLSDYDAVHAPAGRDLVADFVEGCRAEGIVPMLYHTTLDWYQESFEKDFDTYLDYLHASVEVLCRNYGPLGGLWFDGNWSKADADWKEDRLYGIIRQHQPEAMIINNTGIHKRGELGHPEIDSTTFEQGRPEPMDREGMPKYLAAEMCQTMNMHWGIGKNDFNYIAPPQVIENLCACRKVGANYLLNVGPTAEGRIPEYEKACLERTGDWVSLYAEPIYDGKPCGIQGEGDDFGLVANGKYYLFIHNLAARGDKNVTLAVGGTGPRSFQGVPEGISTATWTDNGEELRVRREDGKFVIKTTGFPYGTNTVVRVARLG
ncbi:MAG: alpha-L-fucosidase [Candidatus Hydrogenedentes bacterium]|nr:alpha-L-fucosidase [Candidatus Hydrogenedentota bacterium]